MPGATQSIQWGDARVLKVGGKMFAVFRPPGAEPTSLSFKCDDLGFQLLTELGGFRPAPYLARAKWVNATDSVPLSADELEAYLKRAYETVLAKLPKKTRAAMGQA
ncbi:MAG: MmcQ/YjbR family DNA-binding protein [Proteobacteria bacterium]|nr:MmcQ/YjbR family DNA-binding protein [Pseudomonadota bacterium]MBI3498167.1 MmcQ/YjbR family DNA-binding protein [Pseudomonadota bacterium]